MSRPDETGGGILADEMGMGKTLSMLALIIRTLDAAHTWATQDYTVDGEMSQMPKYKHRSGATLIVASSDCKCSMASFEPHLLIVSIQSLSISG